MGRRNSTDPSGRMNHSCRQTRDRTPGWFPASLRDAAVVSQPDFEISNFQSQIPLCLESKNRGANQRPIRCLLRITPNSGLHSELTRPKGLEGRPTTAQGKASHRAPLWVPSPKSQPSPARAPHPVNDRKLCLDYKNGGLAYSSAIFRNSKNANCST